MISANDGLHSGEYPSFPPRRLREIDSGSRGMVGQMVWPGGILNAIKKLCFCLLSLLVALVACTAYDHDTPDTAANLAGFERHFGFAAPDAVTDVYYYADEMGADVIYQLGFAAGPETVACIVAALELAPADAAARRDFNLARDDLAWWDEADIAQAAFYQKANDQQDYWQALWYSEATGRVYYLEYSL